MKRDLARKLESLGKIRILDSGAGLMGAMDVYGELRAKGFAGKIKVVIDEFDQLKMERRLMRVLELSRLVVEQRSKAEEETAVAAASILARAARELWIDRESRRLGINLRKISPTEALSYDNSNEFAKVSFLQHK